MTTLIVLLVIISVVIYNGVKQMAALDDLKASVTKIETVQASAVALLQNLSAQLKAALAAGDMSAVEDIANQLSTDADNLSTAITANTPASS